VLRGGGRFVCVAFGNFSSFSPPPRSFRKLCWRIFLALSMSLSYLLRVIECCGCSRIRCSAWKRLSRSCGILSRSSYLDAALRIALFITAASVCGGLIRRKLGYDPSANIYRDRWRYTRRPSIRGMPTSRLTPRSLLGTTEMERRNSDSLFLSRILSKLEENRNFCDLIAIPASGQFVYFTYESFALRDSLYVSKS